MFVLHRILAAVLITSYCAAALSGPVADEETQNSVHHDLRREALALEHGEGVARDPVRAAALYCQIARAGDAQAQYNLGWMYANGRGVARNDATAAFFFQAAAQQGMAAAQRMLHIVGEPTREPPECMSPPEPPPPASPLVAIAPKENRPRVNYEAIAPPKIFDLVMKMAPQFQVEPQLALAIIAAESNFNSLALSPKNAQGLMQLIPATSDRFRVSNPFDPAQNIKGGLTYLRWLLAYFQGDIALVAAAYNAGEGAVERHRGIPPYLETRAYVQRILKSVGALSHAFDEKITKPSPTLHLFRLALTK
jgi:soluble lytic murein transglycosylase-like protein